MKTIDAPLNNVKKIVRGGATVNLNISNKLTFKSYTLIKTIVFRNNLLRDCLSAYHVQMLSVSHAALRIAKALCIIVALQARFLRDVKSGDVFVSVF